MLPCKAQNVQPSILVGTQKEDASNYRFCCRAVLSPGPTNEGGSLGEGAVVVDRVKLDIERMGKKGAENALGLGIM